MSIEEIIQRDIDEICTFGHYSVAEAYKTLLSAKEKIQSQAKEIGELKSGRNTMVYGGRQIGKTYLINLEKENDLLKQKLKESEVLKSKIKEFINRKELLTSRDVKETLYEILNNL